MFRTSDISTQAIRAILENVMDPEIPVLSIIDLGIVREITLNKQDREFVEVSITPTYTGCPAMDVIRATIEMELRAAGFSRVVVKQILTPAWTTDWMSEEGKRKLLAYGIAPPNAGQSVCHPELFASDEAVQCPHCQSWNTRRISEFGSTACKALYQCEDCREPFDYFKCH